MAASISGGNKFSRHRVQRNIFTVLSFDAVRGICPQQVQTGQASRAGLPPDVRSVPHLGLTHRAQRFLQGQPADVPTVNLIKSPACDHRNFFCIV